MADSCSTIELVSGIAKGSPLSQLLGSRAEIMALSEASHVAVLRPDDPGGLSHGERAAFAARMATLNQDERLATHYRDLIEDDAHVALADPAFKAETQPRIAALLRHIDRITLSPRDATRDDIEALKRAGVTEADIVRLSELIAFVNYQARVIATLRLLGRGA